MTAFFQYARQNIDEEPDEEVAPVFHEVARRKKQQAIPFTDNENLEEDYEDNRNEDQTILNTFKEMESYKSEHPIETIGREVASHGARAAEGFFGGIGQFFNLLTPELYENEEGMPYGPGEAPQGLPGPQQLRELTKEATGKYLEPKSKLSEGTQEIVSDIGSMFSTPGLGIATKLLVPIAGQAVKQTLKGTGASEKAQDLGKLATMMVTTIAGIGNAPQVAQQAFQEAKAMIPKGLSFTAKPTERALQRLKGMEWYKTGSTPSKAPAMAEVKRVESLIKNGKIDAHEAMQVRHDINEMRKQLGGFWSGKEVADKKAALKYLGEVDKALIESMEHYGKNVNPEWWKNYNLANEAFRVTAKSRAISEFLDKNARPVKSEMAKILMHTAGGVISALPTAAVSGVAAAVPVIATVKTLQIMNRMAKSTVLRNHYIEVMKAASQGNAAVMNKMLEKFDREAKKIESGSKKRKGLNVSFDPEAENDLNQD